MMNKREQKTRDAETNVNNKLNFDHHTNLNGALVQSISFYHQQTSHCLGILFYQKNLI